MAKNNSIGKCPDCGAVIALAFPIHNCYPKIDPATIKEARRWLLGGTKVVRGISSGFPQEMIRVIQIRIHHGRVQGKNINSGEWENMKTLEVGL